jgi:hypothetical protein
MPPRQSNNRLHLLLCKTCEARNVFFSTFEVDQDFWQRRSSGMDHLATIQQPIGKKMVSDVIKDKHVVE